MNYEIQIFAKDRKKIIRFKENQEGTSLNTVMAWEDFYYAMGSVIDDKADKFRENNTLIGRLKAEDMPYDSIVDEMCEDLSPALTKILTEDKEISEIEMV